MQDLFQKQHLPPDKWIELHGSLVECLRLLPTTDWRPAIAPSRELADEAERKHIQKLLYDEYISVVPTTTAAIQQIVTTSTWPPLPPKELYFLRLMLSGAISFVRSVVVGRVGPPRTIVPFPDTDVATVALWLLSEWWFHHGIHEAYENATTDEVLFHKYFS